MMNRSDTDIKTRKRLWSKPWGMKEGFALGAGLLVVGLLLQTAFGPIDWDFFAAPVNYIAMALLLGLIAAIYLLRRKVRAFEWLMHFQAAVPCICCATALTIVMGLTVQTPYGGIPWLSQMLQFWPFALVWIWMMVIAGLASLNHLLRWKWREIPFIANHLGVFLAVVCATLGSADLQTLEMTVFEGSPERMAMDEDGFGYEMDFTVGLQDFVMDTYENGMPKRFASDITVTTKDGRDISGTVDVNKPLKVEGWNIYQYDYDARSGPESQYSVLLLVRDPWLPGVYLGIFLMLAGALWLLFLKYSARRWWVLLVALVLTGFFTFLTVTRMGPSAKTLPPALQSPWFIPHLIVYMAGYALLATATLVALYQLIFRRFQSQQVMDNLVYVGLAFLTFGMLFGALWAKEAWGHYWSWDPKETWAAITWLCYLIYLHFRKARPDDRRTACWILLFAFVCLQICWWGINYLPSAQDHSVHVY